MKSIYFKLFSVILISFLGFVVYSNTFHCSFHFDDIFFITENFAIRNIQNIHDIWNFLPCRFIFYLTLALNYHFHQLDVVGYHVVNLIIHIISSILVWWFVLLTLSTPAIKGGTIEKSIIGKKSSQKSNRNAPVLKMPQSSAITGHANLVALFAALVFVSHPIQTQAVTYLMQRAAALGTLFYVATFCFYVKSRLLQENKSSKALVIFYYICALIMAVAAMYTKETSITLPLSMVLYEFCFLSSIKNFNWKALAPFLLTIFIIPATMSMTKSINSSEMKHVMEGATNVTTSQYVLTQFRVMVTYIRLIFLPINQNLDYDYPVFNSIFELPVLFSFLFLIAILIFTIRSFSKYRLIFFSVFWFFLTLLPESSLFPMKDVIFEHRLYLSMLGYSLFLVSGAYYLFGKNNLVAMVIVLSFIIGGNSFLTYQRNKVWKDELSLWEDTVQKSPNKARPYNNRGKTYFEQGNLSQALADCNKAIELDPQYEEAYNNRGIIYDKEGYLSQAMSDFNKAIEINPSHIQTYINRGSTFFKMGNFKQSIADCNKAIEIEPRYPEPYNNRGSALTDLGQYTQALADFNKALELKPGYAEAYNNRCFTYIRQEKFTQAMSDCNKAIELNPEYKEAYNNLGIIHDKQGNIQQAIKDYSKSIELDPGYAEAYTNLGVIYAKQGNNALAIINFSKAIEKNPAYISAYADRGLINENQGNYARALSDYNKTIELNPANPDTYFNRGNVYFEQKNFVQAVADYSKAIELNPQNAAAYSNRAISFFQLKDYDNSWRDVRKTQDLKGAVNPQLINALKQVTAAGGQE